MKKVKFKKIAIIFIIVCSLFFIFNEKGLIIAKGQGYRALKVFAQVRNTEVMSYFLTYETEHFILRYKDKDENVVRNVARLFEDSYRAVNEEYGYYHNSKMIVFIYEDQQTMWDYQWSVRGQAVMGFYSMGIIHILSPNAYQENKLNPIDFFEKNGPILHEYVHKVVDDISSGNVELWLTEGIALYEEYEKVGIEWAKNFEYEKLFGANELRNTFVTIEEIQAYRQSFDAVRIIIETYGKDKLLKVLELLGEGNNLDNAFIETYGFSVDEYLNNNLTQLLK
jgi:hypothetical protein